MRTNDFICSCFGIDGDVIDSICDDFDIDFDDDDVKELFVGFTYVDDEWHVGKKLLHLVYDRIIEKYDVLDKDKFGYDFTSPSYPSFYYNDVPFKTKEELDAIVEGLDEEEDEEEDEVC